MNEATADALLAIRTVFTSIVNLGVLFLVSGTWVAGRRLGEDPRTSRRWMLGALLGAVAWLSLCAALALRGVFLDVNARPPAIAVFLPLATAGTVALAFSPFGTRLARGLTPLGLVGFQGLRVGIEGVLHALHGLGVVPLQMTWSGWNFDVVSGGTALLFVLMWKQGLAGRRTLLAWNVVGLVLLANVVTIAVLSMPLPLRLFWNAPANTFVFHAPWIWLPAFLVQGALLGHLLVFRWLALHPLAWR